MSVTATDWAAGFDCNRPFAKNKRCANDQPDSDREQAPLPLFSRSAQQGCRSARKQKYDEADSPNAGNRRELDNGERIHLCVSEIAPCAVRRRRRGKIFVRHPVNGKSKRREEERSAANESADE